MRSITVILMLLFGSLYSQTIPMDMNEPAARQTGPDALTVDIDPADIEMTDLPLPPDDSAEYWVLRSDAVQEFIPLLTKKRSEMKTRLRMLTDYLLQIGKASEFALQSIPDYENPKVYAEILKIGPGLQKLNVELPKKRPAWDQLVEIAMQHVLHEGYLPTEVEPSEKDQYIAACQKKEEYGQKVRDDIRTIMDQCAGMWVYLDQIGRLGDFKAHETEVALRQEAEYAAEREAAMQQKQSAALQRTEDRRQREYEQRMARREFSSSRRELDYYYRQQRLLYRQSLLDQRFINSRSYYY